MGFMNQPTEVGDCLHVFQPHSQDFRSSSLVCLPLRCVEVHLLSLRSSDCSGGVGGLKPESR